MTDINSSGWPIVESDGCPCCGAVLVREPCLDIKSEGESWVQEQVDAINAAGFNNWPNTASKPLPESQGPEMTQEQVQAFKAIWTPFIDVLKGNAP